MCTVYMHYMLIVSIFFTVHDPPSNIVVTSQYPGSPRAKVEWSFAGETSDLTHFRVMVQVDGKVLTDQEALSGMYIAMTVEGCSVIDNVLVKITELKK